VHWSTDAERKDALLNVSSALAKSRIDGGTDHRITNVTNSLMLYQKEGKREKVSHATAGRFTGISSEATLLLLCCHGNSNTHFRSTPQARMWWRLWIKHHSLLGLRWRGLKLGSWGISFYQATPIAAGSRRSLSAARLHLTRCVWIIKSISLIRKAQGHVPLVPWIQTVKIYGVCHVTTCKSVGLIEFTCLCMFKAVCFSTL
jgi:hypothetical protein